LAGVIAGVVFSPVLIWNARHEWASFKFQLGHGLGAESSGALLRLAEFLGGQVLVCTPVLFALAATALVASLRMYRGLPLGRRVLVWCSLMPLLLFSFSSLRRSPEANWPVLAYAPLMVLAALYVGEAWSDRRVAWARYAIAVALVCGLLSLHVELFVRLGLPLGHANQLFGYRELGQRLGSVRRGPVLANRYQEASEAAFYTPGRPEVWALNLGDSRSNAFDYFPGKPDLTALREATFLNCPKEEIARLFTIVEEIECPTIVTGRVLRTDRILIATRPDPGARSTDGPPPAPATQNRP
jgi:hypothetical protein